VNANPTPAIIARHVNMQRLAAADEQFRVALRRRNNARALGARGPLTRAEQAAMIEFCTRDTCQIRHHAPH
jgi:hypothetical protein